MQITLKDAPTSFAITGGTDLLFTEDSGVSVANGKYLSASSVTDYRVRPFFTVKTRPPSYNATTGEFTRAKRWITYKLPVILANGKISYQTYREEAEIHPELDSTAQGNFLNNVSQLNFNAAMRAFIITGNCD